MSNLQDPTLNPTSLPFDPPLNKTKHLQTYTKAHTEWDAIYLFMVALMTQSVAHTIYCQIVELLMNDKSETVMT